MPEFDVLVIGAGVAGAASAIELARSGWRVGVIHRDDSVSAVESLSPAAVRSLQAYSIDIGSPFTEVVAWWGSGVESRAVYPGARLADRSLVAKALRARAVDESATLIESRGSLRIQKTGAGWQMAYTTPSGGKATLDTQYLVDATGRSAFVGRNIGAHRIDSDRLFSISVSLADVPIAGTWTESVSNGWWNVCGDGRNATLSFFSTSAVIREARHDLASYFAESRNLRRFLPAPRFSGLAIRYSGSSRLSPCAGTGWASVGDAAATLQPLASAGVAKALRDARLVRRALAFSPEEYDAMQAEQHMVYLKRLDEQRKRLK